MGLRVHSDLSEAPLLTMQLRVVQASCAATLGWASTVAGETVSRDCWAVDASRYATGRASRHCSKDGVWLSPDESGCSLGGWNAHQAAFLRNPAVTALGQVAGSSEAVFPFLL